jgi:cytochrome c-type biogenesis protein CcmH
MIYLVFALLTGAAVMAVLAPLASRGARRDAVASDVDFFKEQIAEIERENADGRLDAADAETAKTEAARRLLRAQASQSAVAPPSRKYALAAAIGAIALMPLLALGLYSRLGHVDMPDMPITARLNTPPERLDLAGAVARIEAHLREHPDDGRGLEVVAPYYLREGRFEDAVHALSEALRLLGPTAQRYAALGEARSAAAQGSVTQAARADFEAALKLDPALPMARFYLGLAAAQNGAADEARELWSKLVADSPVDAPWVPVVKAQLERLDGGAPKQAQESGPSSAEGKAVAALPSDERAKMIRTMVERLANRLEKQGDDVEGWLRLIRAYSVLEEADRARAALESGRKALAAKPDEAKRLDALARELNIGG